MLARLFPSREQRAMQVTPWGDWGHTRLSSAGVNVSTDNALQLLAVYGCTALIADTISTLPRDVYRSTDPPREAPKPSWLEPPRASDGVVDFGDFVGEALVSLLLDGNAYLPYGFDRSFVTNSVECLDPSRVEVPVVDGRAVYTVDGNPFVGRMLHLKGITRPGYVKGLSPLEAARQSVGGGLAAQEYSGKFWSNGAHLSGVIQMPGDLTAEAARILKEKWSRDHAGLARAHEPGVLTGGAEWKPLSVTPEQAQFLETRKFTAAEIAGQMFHVDPSMLGIGVDGTSLTYANLEQRGTHFVQFTLLKWIVRIERAITWLLPRPQYFKFNVAGLERADLATRYQAYAVGTGGAPFLTVDEVREKEDLGPMPPGAMPVPPAATPQEPPQ